ncbi:hypothetical protein [Streptomyces sp. NPDC020362]|uniref:hypothetical protein n=1 Tax=unclassified Streptomyces TaxID=2593676 RepID=UPI0033D4CF71
MAVTAVLSAVGLVVDDRVLAGAPIWAKPFKFSVSFAAYCLSLAWMLSFLPGSRRVGRWAGTVVALTSLVEMVIIIGQAARGRRSHFNYATPFDEALYNTMAVTVAVLWTATLVVAVLLLRARIADRASAWAMRSGIVLALAGAAVGFRMAQPAPGQRRGVSQVVGAHSVGVPDGGPSMPLTGWSTTGGDLRIPHFVGLHALQLLPALVMVLTVLAPRFPRLADDRVRLRLVLLGSGAYAAAFGLVLRQALQGRPLIHPDTAMLGAAGLVLLAVVLGTYGSLRAARTPSARKATDTEGTSTSTESTSASTDSTPTSRGSTSASAESTPTSKELTP